MAEIQDTIREIKSKFRLFMNGMVSQSMREKGIDYKLNFGIEYPRIKEIAADYPCNHEWHRLCGKRTSANARLWPDYFSLSRVFVGKSLKYG